MAKMIIFIIIVVILALAISTAFSTYIALNKGLGFKTGLLWGIFLPFFGIIVLAMKPQTDLKVVNEMYDRNMMSINDLEKTQELLTKSLKTKNK